MGLGHFSQDYNKEALSIRLLYDFTTPTEELAKLKSEFVPTEEIAIYHEAIGDVWTDGLNMTSMEKRNAALSGYAKGKITFEELAEQLNIIYTG